MLIHILKNIKAATCPLGIKIKEYQAGNTEEIFDELAQTFIKEGWGEKMMPKIENKAILNTPENKEFSEEKTKKIKK
jgi:hypothetical protein